ncbi:hypothetical protein CRE_03122 [Caenorhabditis remanei]|uniref:Uncharacterized protein n=1 Tax=Caenorhabditis remanei TaxID=31234 RepID=E3LWN4_CAERE|nr:hypothetical protein CRE_03122 [Caenorhabditis remanei]
MIIYLERTREIQKEYTIMMALYIKLSTDGSIDHAFIYLLKSWRADLLKTSSEMMSSYSSLGAHGRQYVDSENVTNEEDMYQFM